MAGTGPGDLYDLAEELLEVCVQALDSVEDFPPPQPDDYQPGAPDRRFVSPHAPIADCCEFLAVHVNNITDAFARTGASGGGGGAEKANVPSLIATLLRCVPVGTGEGQNYTPPPTAQLEAAARLLYADAWALWNHIYNLIRADEFLTKCQRVDFVSMQSIAPEGGCGGWQLAFVTELHGYEEPGT